MCRLVHRVLLKTAGHTADLFCYLPPIDVAEINYERPARAYCSKSVILGGRSLQNAQFGIVPFVNDLWHQCTSFSVHHYMPVTNWPAYLCKNYHANEHGFYGMAQHRTEINR